MKVGREIRYRALGAELNKTARTLERIGAEWDRRLAAIKQIAESMEEVTDPRQGSSAGNASAFSAGSLLLEFLCSQDISSIRITDDTRE